MIEKNEVLTENATRNDIPEEAIKENILCNEHC